MSEQKDYIQERVENLESAFVALLGTVHETMPLELAGLIDTLGHEFYTNARSLGGFKEKEENSND